MKNTTPLEHDEAIVLKEYLDILVTQGKIVCYSHIPQETFTKSWGIKRKNKQEGVHVGVPDYIVVTSQKTMFVELKRKKGGAASPEQKVWIEALNEAGSPSAICLGFDQAKEFIDRNL